LNQINVFAR